MPIREQKNLSIVWRRRNPESSPQRAPMHASFQDLSAQSKPSCEGAHPSLPWPMAPLSFQQVELPDELDEYAPRLPSLADSQSLFGRLTTIFEEIEEIFEEYEATSQENHGPVYFVDCSTPQPAPCKRTLFGARFLPQGQSGSIGWFA